MSDALRYSELRKELLLAVEDIGLDPVEALSAVEAQLATALPLRTPKQRRFAVYKAWGSSIEQWGRATHFNLDGTRARELVNLIFPNEGGLS
jgi:hypothetical protein